MCGVAGCFSVSAQPGLAENARKMAESIGHRGPDDAGTWADNAAGVALGHRRLAIVDLSAAGHQPMHSVSGTWVIAFNGEVYNHMALRATLELAGAAPVWRGHSDTETLLAAFEHWGVEGTLQRCVGMFAIALWHRESRTLTLARDRFGEKPLYYGWVGRGLGRALVFGSELKALRAYPGFDALVCREALAQYLRFTYVPAPRSIYQDIYKLEPGCLLTVQGSPPEDAPVQPIRPGKAHGSVALRRWWPLAGAIESGAGRPFVNEAEALIQLEAQLTETLGLQSLADVPLGAFLSGGIDSSTIVALMQRQSPRPVKTFTIGFNEDGFDESPHALAVACHLGTEHTEVRVTSQTSQDVILRLPDIYDEPFADSSQIPTHIVCHATQQHVSVALSGDGGDELFGGYNRYFWGPKIWSKVAWLPYSSRRILGELFARIPIGAWDVLGNPLATLRGADGVSRIGDKLHKLGRRMQHVLSMDDLYLSLVSEWPNPASLVRSGDDTLLLEPLSILDDPLPVSGLDAPALKMMYQDAMTYLPDDILCKVDRAAMATSLETRAPFLDHRVFELAWRLPLNMKIRGNTGKWALRQILYKYVPRELIERPKAGFAVPIGQWLRGPLREWAEALLDERRLETEGYFYPAPIRAVWHEHLGGRRDHTPKLWAILMFQAWLEENSRPTVH